MRCLFLYNPNSGRGKIKKKLAYIEKQLSRRYDEVTVLATHGAEDMEEQVRRGAETYDAIVFSGGDGTFHLVLQGLAGRDVQLGYLPAGTANDVARSLGIPRSLKGALNVIVKGNSRQIDCMRVNKERYVVYVAAAGAFTSVTYETPQRTKRALGWLAYVVQGLKKNFKLDVFPLRVECGGRTVETHGVLVFVMNGRSIAGFPVNKSASMNDGKLEVAVVKQAEKPGFFKRVGALFSIASLMLFGCKVRKRDIEVMEGDSVRITTDSGVVWDYDGEKGTTGSVEIEVLPERVRLFVPKNKKI